MTINSSSLLSLLSTDNSLEKLQQSIQLDNGARQAFTDTFLANTKQINSLHNSEYLTENSSTNTPENTDKQHELAGWLNEKSITTGFPSLFGKSLPIKLENDIDLENTLESLANVLLALEEFEFNSDEIQTKLSTTIEKAETIKSSVPEQIELGEKLSKLVNELEGIKKDISNSLEINIAKHVMDIDMELEDNSNRLINEDSAYTTSASNNEEKLLVSEKLDLESGITKEKIIPTQTQKKLNITKPVVESTVSLINDRPPVAEKKIQEQSVFVSENLVKRINKVVDSIKQIEDTLSENEALADLESQIEFLTTDINSIRDTLNQNFPVIFPESKFNNDLNYQLDKTDLGDEEDEVIQPKNQIGGIATSLPEPIRQEKVNAESQLVGQPILEEKPEIKKEIFSLKQMAEERALNISTKDPAETLLQQENSFPKSFQDKPAITAIQNEKVEVLGSKDLNQSQDKGTLKFISDFSNLNKAMIFENKTELPSMDKHFAHPEWNKEFGERIIWMHKQATPSAELRLNPKHLGPITIKLDITQDQATVAFTAQHTAVKEAIDAAIPKLREMFSAQQLNLVEVNVSQDNLDQRHSRGYSQMWGEQGKSDDQNTENMDEEEHINTAMEIVDEIESGRAMAGNGLLSIFA